MDKELAAQKAKKIQIDIEQVLREWWEMAILREIFSSSISESLIFKGGTALRLAYGSPRFSEDLDFSRLKDFSFEMFKENIESIGKKYSELTIRDIADKFYTFIAQFRISEPWRPLAFSVKIEVSKRAVEKNYKFANLINLRSEISNIEVLGNVMAAEQVYREKLQALESRDAPRDLFDLWYLDNYFKRPFNLPEKKFNKKLVIRDLRKYLPRNYWQVIETLCPD